MTLATFIDVIVFLLAYASGPFFFGAPELRWICRPAAALDAADEQVFVRDLLAQGRRPGRRAPAVRGRRHRSARASGSSCLVLAARGLAAPAEEDGRRAYLLDAGFHQRLVESLAARGVALQAASSEATNAVG